MKLLPNIALYSSGILFLFIFVLPLHVAAQSAMLSTDQSFAELDINGDKKLSFQELAKNILKKARKGFNQLDLNGDSYVTRQEIDKFRKIKQQKRKNNSGNSAGFTR